MADKDRAVFYTAHGRQVKDGGGVEVDVKVEPQKASPLEIILLNSGSYSDYAAEWSKKYELTGNFKVDDATYKDFQRFVEKRQKDGDMKLEILYDSQLKELQKKLKASKFGSSSRELEKLRSDIIKDVKKDFSTYKVSCWYCTFLRLFMIYDRNSKSLSILMLERNHRRSRAEYTGEIPA